MDFKNFFFGLTPDERKHFAANANTSVGHLNNVAYRYTTASPRLCVLIEKLSAGEVTRKDMLPDDFVAIWPELAPPKKRKGA